MQLPSIDRTPQVRPAGAEAPASVANRVIPVAPVNPVVEAAPPSAPVTVSAPSPGVVNLVNPSYRTAPLPNEGEPVYTSVPDPASSRRFEQAAPRDWTIHRPAPQKVEDPPPKPISQILMDHLRSVWNASASAIQVTQANDLQTPPPQPAQASLSAGDLAKQAITYQPTRIKKTEDL